MRGANEKVNRANMTLSVNTLSVAVRVKLVIHSELPSPQIPGPRQVATWVASIR